MAEGMKRHKLSYDYFCKLKAGGTHVYSFNLVDLSPKDSPQDSTHDLGKLYRDITKILHKIKETIEQVEDGRKREIKQYYIGKTFAQKQPTAPEFDHMDKDTWLKKGIVSRSKRHFDNGHGKGGLVILTAITKSMIPIQAQSLKITHEDYALALEQQVINHLVFEKADKRVVNPASSEGRRQIKNSHKTDKTGKQLKDADEQQKSTEKEDKNADAFLIYMAFSHEGVNEHEATPKKSLEKNPVPKKSTRKRSPITSPSYGKAGPSKKPPPVKSILTNEGVKVNPRKRSQIT